MNGLEGERKQGSKAVREGRAQQRGAQGSGREALQPAEETNPTVARLLFFRLHCKGNV